MGLIESSLTTITKPFSCLNHIVMHHVIHQVVLRFVVKQIIAFLI